MISNCEIWWTSWETNGKRLGGFLNKELLFLKEIVGLIRENYNFFILLKLLTFWSRSNIGWFFKGKSELWIKTNELFLFLNVNTNNYRNMILVCLFPEKWSHFTLFENIHAFSFTIFPPKPISSQVIRRREIGESFIISLIHHINWYLRSVFF